MLRRCIKRSRTNSNLDPILACVLCDVSLGREQTNFHQRFYTYNSRPMFNLKPLLAVTQKHTHLVIPKKLQRAPCLAIRHYLGLTIERRNALLKLILADWWHSAYEVAVSTDELKIVLESDRAQ